MSLLEKEDISRYQKLFQEQEEIILSEKDIVKIIQSIDDMGHLLFKKYLSRVGKQE